MISLETLRDNTPSARNFDKLAQLVLDTGGQSAGIRFGTGTCTFGGGSRMTSATTVSHGLGRTPAAILATVNYGSSDPDETWSIRVSGADDDSFDVRVSNDTAMSAGWAVPFYWLAIG